MATSPEQALWWERFSDSEDDVGSARTVIVEFGVSARPWEPSMMGSLRGRSSQGSPGPGRFKSNGVVVWDVRLG